MEPGIKQYEEPDTQRFFAHEERMRLIDPRAILLCFLGVTVAIVLTSRANWLYGEVLIALAIVFSCKAIGELLRTLRALWLFLLLVALASWWTDGIGAIGPACARVLALVASATACFALASPEDMAEALRQWGVPLRITFLVGAGLRFVPLIAETYQELRAAQEARGIRFDPFWRHISAYLALLIPLLREVFRLAEQLAQAMETRGFSVPSRTSAIEYRWQIHDLAIALLGAGIVICVLLLGR